MNKQKFNKVVMLFKNRKWLSCALVIIVCLNLSGCATLWTVGNGFATLLANLVMLPVHALSKLVDIANALPKPPPGVF